MHPLFEFDNFFFFSFFSVLLEQIAGTNAEGNNLPLGDAAKELAEAQQMMTEMRNRNFSQLQADAVKERKEAQLCKSLFSQLLTL